MIRRKYFYLAIVTLSICAVAAFILPLGPDICPGLNCRGVASANWDFSSAPEPKLTVFPSPEGLSTIPTP